MKYMILNISCKESASVLGVKDKNKKCTPPNLTNKHQPIQYIPISFDVLIPMEEVHGVLGQKIGLPCDLTPRDRDDGVSMVLWFKEVISEPLYR
ncbi:hypothetical protein HHI36_000430 [Cryptolaemus montrouzieri]|uniref:Uncharacterized protein n=1 Tax=Cryptolaemus montrouzieri TaxID=559131 RepID=A0ABD2P5B8_9CUCU